MHQIGVTMMAQGAPLHWPHLRSTSPESARDLKSRLLGKFRTIIPGDFNSGNLTRFLPFNIWLANDFFSEPRCPPYFLHERVLIIGNNVLMRAESPHELDEETEKGKQRTEVVFEEEKQSRLRSVGKQRTEKLRTCVVPVDDTS